MRLKAAAIKARVDLPDLMRRYCPGKVTVTPNGARGPCPFHDDHNPSFSGLDETKYLTCFAGCFAGDVIAFVQRMDDLEFQDAVHRLAEWYAPDLLESKPNGRPPHKKQPSGTIVAIYPYTDADGKLLYEKVRLQPKGFYIRRPDGQGGYIRDLGDLPRVLYRLPAVLKEKHLVILVEGERDVATAESFGFVATCNPFGAKDWRREYSLALQGTECVLVIADNDPEGIAHASESKADLKGLVGRAVATVMPYGKDVTQWVEGGGTAEQFQEWMGNSFMQQSRNGSRSTHQCRSPTPTTSLTLAMPGASLGITARTCATATPWESG